MRLQNGARKIKSEASAFGAALGGIGAVEAVEDVGDIARRNARPLILHTDDNLLRPCLAWITSFSKR